MKDALHDIREQYYKQKKGTVTVVNVPPMNFIRIEGSGDPNTEASFSDAVSLLYKFSYTIKFMMKKKIKQILYSVMPLEGLWWADDMNDFTVEKKNAWKWSMMIMQPGFITHEDYLRAAEQITETSKQRNPLLGMQKFGEFHEGPAAQILHCGRYEDEGPTVGTLHAFISDNGYSLCGKHHEIYFGDPRRQKPASMKTILRQPIRKK